MRSTIGEKGDYRLELISDFEKSIEKLIIIEFYRLPEADRCSR